jgi:hypothetical protein
MPRVSRTSDCRNSWRLGGRAVARERALVPRAWRFGTIIEASEMRRVGVIWLNSSRAVLHEMWVRAEVRKLL